MPTNEKYTTATESGIQPLSQSQKDHQRLTCHEASRQCSVNVSGSPQQSFSDIGGTIPKSIEHSQCVGAGF